MDIFNQKRREGRGGEYFVVFVLKDKKGVKHKHKRHKKKKTLNEQLDKNWIFCFEWKC